MTNWFGRHASCFVLDNTLNKGDAMKEIAIAYSRNSCRILISVFGFGSRFARHSVAFVQVKRKLTEFRQRERDRERFTYPCISNNELRLLFRDRAPPDRAYLPALSNSIKAPNGSIPFSLDSSIGATAQIDIDRRSPPPRPQLTVEMGRDWVAWRSMVSWAARHGSEPAAEPEVVLSRRNRPITEFIGLGFDRPPDISFCANGLIFVFCSKIRIDEDGEKEIKLLQFSGAKYKRVLCFIEKYVLKFVPIQRNGLMKFSS